MGKREYIEKIEIYEKGIKRLGELKRELNSLDTRKFKKYASAIRKKLKFVSKIPEIEENIRELKLRMAGVDVDSKKALIDLKQDNRINRISRGQNNLRYLEPEADKVPFLEKRAKFLVNELGVKSEEIGINTGEIDKLKKKTSKLGFFSKLLGKHSEDLEDKKQDIVKLKSSLSDIRINLTHKNKELVKDEKEIKRLNTRISSLKKVIQEKTNKLNSKIDNKRNPINRKKLYAEIDSLNKKLLSLEAKSNSFAEKKVMGKLQYRIKQLQNGVEDLENYARKKQLTRREVTDVSDIPHLKRELSSLKEESENLESEILSVRKAAKRAKELSKDQLRNIERLPSLKRRIAFLENEVASPKFIKVRAIKAEKTKKDFSVYSKGVKHLRQLEKELNSLDTSKFKKYEAAIRKKLQYVSMIPEIEEDLRNLKLRVAGVDVDYKKSAIDQKQDKNIGSLKKEGRELKQEIEPKIKSIPALKHKLKLFSKLLGVKSEQIGVNSGQIEQEEKDLERFRLRISHLQKVLNSKMDDLEKQLNKKDVRSFLNKRKLEREIRDLRDKIDESRLELSTKVAKETSESQWMIQKEKEEIKKELSDALARARQDFEQNKVELSKEILEKINNIDKKVVSNKDDLYKGLLDKLVQIKSELNEVKKDLEEKNQQKIQPKKEEKIEMKMHLEKPIAPKKQITPLPRMPLFEAKRSEEFSRLILKQGVSETKGPIFPEIPKFGMPSFPMKPAEPINPVQIKIPVKKNKKYSKNKFFIIEEFENAYREFERLKYRVDDFEHSVKKNYITRANEQELISKTLNDSENTLETLSKINSGVLKPFKI